MRQPYIKNYRPTAGKVLILPIYDPTEIPIRDGESKIILPMAKKRARKGVVAQKGPELPGRPMVTRKKDIVYFIEDKGVPVQLKGQVYIVIDEQYILAKD